MLYVVISADNCPPGWPAPPLQRLSSLTSVSFTAVQYAIFSSLMTLFPSCSAAMPPGSMVEAVGYAGFFILTTLLGLPVLVLVWRAGRRLES